MSQSNIEGEYYLQGVHEMASGFLLKADSTFQFFFSYGALDRSGEGQWAIDKGILVLYSSKGAYPDFQLLDSSNTGKSAVTIRIEESNSILRKHVYGSLDDGIPGSWIPADANGEIHFPKQQFQSVSLLLEFCPERITRIPIPDKEQNQFSFRMLPGIMEVYFNKFSLDVSDGQLKGRHPLLEGSEFVYQKNG